MSRKRGGRLPEGNYLVPDSRASRVKMTNVGAGKDFAQRMLAKDRGETLPDAAPPKPVVSQKEEKRAAQGEPSNRKQILAMFDPPSSSNGRSSDEIAALSNLYDPRYWDGDGPLKKSAINFRAEAQKKAVFRMSQFLLN